MHTYTSVNTSDPNELVCIESHVYEPLKDTKAAKAITSQTFNTIYDIMAASISLADIATDIIILVQFYLQNRMIFFYASLSILLLANLSYVMVFMKRYTSGTDFLGLICVGFMLFPIAPVLSFLMYFMDDNNGCVTQCVLNRCLRNFQFGFYGFVSSERNSHLHQWFETKISKHIGWILESVLESIPQTVLQMIAIVYYNEINIIFFISIALSMMSISTKSLIFSAAISITNKTMLYTWVSSIADFCGLFMSISWIFYSNDAFNGALKMIRILWVAKICVFVVPLCVYLSLNLWIRAYGRMLWQFSGNSYTTNKCVGGPCVYIVGFVLVTALWAFGVFLGVIGLEIGCFMNLAYGVYSMGHGRVPHSKSNKIWLNILDFIKNQAMSYDIDMHSEIVDAHVTRAQDKIVRICSVNRQLLLMKNSNPKLHAFLTEKEHKTQFRDVTYVDIRRHTHNEEHGRLLWSKFIDWYTFQYKQSNGLDRCFWFFLLYVLLPWYGVSRVITVLFPYIILVILHIYSGSNAFYADIGTFQIVMLWMYCIFVVLVIILLAANMEDEHIIFHLSPEKMGSNSLYKYLDDTFYFMCKNYYDRLIIKPMILSILCNTFQNDLGTLVFEYIPFYLDEEQHAKILKQKADEYTAEPRPDWINPVLRAAFRKL
eukprot:112955_1